MTSKSDNLGYEERMQLAIHAANTKLTSNYSAIAKKFDLERTTLAKRHKGQTISRTDRLATVQSGPDRGFFWRPFKKTGPYGPAPPDCSSVPKNNRPDCSVRSFYDLKLETDKKTGPQSGPVSEKAGPDRSYVYMYISKLSDSTKDYYNDFILYL